MIGVSRKFTPKDLNPFMWIDRDFGSDWINDGDLDLANNIVKFGNSSSSFLSTDNYRYIWDFDGSQTLFRSASTTELNALVNGNWSFFWSFDSSNWSGAQHTFYGFLNNSVPNSIQFLVYYISGSNVLSVYASDFSTFGRYDYSWSPSINNQYSISVVRDGSDVRLYIDGVEVVGTWTNQSAFNNALDNFTLTQTAPHGFMQRHIAPYYQFEGKLYTMFLKDSVLSELQIKKLHNYYYGI
jgi:hypothetical protein